MSKPRILCYMNHYFNKNGVFNGQSSNRNPELRRSVVNNALESLKHLENCTVKVCGMEGFSLVELDITFNHLQDSRMLIFESLVEMSKHLNEYDYFINIEDDILMNQKVLDNILDFDRVSCLNEVLLPNRLEIHRDKTFCVDTQKCFPGWINTERVFKDRLIKVAINHHSGILILSRDKFRYAVSAINLTTYSNLFGGVMESSFAHFHKPFCLYRFKDDVQFHSIIHMDSWAPLRPSILKRLGYKSIKRYLKILPGRLNFHVEEIL